MSADHARTLDRYALRHGISHALESEQLDLIAQLIRSRFFPQKAASTEAASLSDDVQQLLRSPLLRPIDAVITWAHWIRHGRPTAQTAAILARAWEGIVPTSQTLRNVPDPHDRARLWIALLASPVAEALPHDARPPERSLGSSDLGAVVGALLSATRRGLDLAGAIDRLQAEPDSILTWELAASAPSVTPEVRTACRRHAFAVAASASEAARAGLLAWSRTWSPSDLGTHLADLLVLLESIESDVLLAEGVEALADTCWRATRAATLGDSGSLADRLAAAVRRCERPRSRRRAFVAGAEVAWMLAARDTAHTLLLEAGELLASSSTDTRGNVPIWCAWIIAAAAFEATGGAVERGSILQTVSLDVPSIRFAIALTDPQAASRCLELVEEALAAPLERVPALLEVALRCLRRAPVGPSAEVAMRRLIAALPEDRRVEWYARLLDLLPDAEEALHGLAGSVDPARRLELLAELAEAPTPGLGPIAAAFIREAPRPAPHEQLARIALLTGRADALRDVAYRDGMDCELASALSASDADHLKMFIDHTAGHRYQAIHSWLAALASEHAQARAEAIDELAAMRLAPTFPGHVEAAEALARLLVAEPSTDPGLREAVARWFADEPALGPGDLVKYRAFAAQCLASVGDQEPALAMMQRLIEATRAAPAATLEHHEEVVRSMPPFLVHHWHRESTHELLNGTHNSETDLMNAVTCNRFASMLPAGSLERGLLNVLFLGTANRASLGHALAYSWLARAGHQHRFRIVIDGRDDELWSHAVARCSPQVPSYKEHGRLSAQHARACSNLVMCGAHDRAQELLDSALGQLADAEAPASAALAIIEAWLTLRRADPRRGRRGWEAVRRALQPIPGGDEAIAVAEAVSGARSWVAVAPSLSQLTLHEIAYPTRLAAHIDRDATAPLLHAMLGLPELADRWCAELLLQGYRDPALRAILTLSREPGRQPPPT